MNELQIVDGADVRQTILWYNDTICIDNMPVFNKQMCRAGVKCVGDIAKPSGRLMSVEELRQKYPLIRINPLTYQGLICAIPLYWKQLLETGGRDNERATDEQGEVQFYQRGKHMPVRLLKARNVYQNFIEKTKPTAEHRWEWEGYRFRNWEKIYSIPYTCTTSTRLQSLHFRIVHRYVPTLKFLHIRNVT